MHVASHVGKALVHIMAVLQSREAMLERGPGGPGNGLSKSLKSAKNVKKMSKRHDLFNFCFDLQRLVVGRTLYFMDIMQCFNRMKYKTERRFLLRICLKK